MAHTKLRISIDFDGVLHDHPGPIGNPRLDGLPVAGAREALAQLAESYRVVVLTGRPEDEHADVWEWLRRNDMADHVAEVTNVKRASVAFIDDQAIRFTEWGSAIAALRRQSPAQGPRRKSKP